MTNLSSLLSQFKIVFPTYYGHIIGESDYDTAKLINIYIYMNPSVINCIKSNESIMGKIQQHN